MSQDSSIARFSLEFFHRDAILFDLTVLSCGAGNGSGANHAIHDRTGIRHRRRDPRRAESTATADDAAGSVGVSESFMVKAERGADTIQWGKVFQILQGPACRSSSTSPTRATNCSSASRPARAIGPMSARRAAERLLLRTEATTDTTRRPCARARGRAARAVARRGSRCGSRRHAPPRPRTTAAGSEAARAAEIARRVLTAAGEAVPERPRATGEEAPHV